MKKNEKTVSVFIPKRFKGDDVRTVSVNGRYIQIPTGKTFEVERCFAEVIMNSNAAEEFSEKHSSELENETL